MASSSRTVLVLLALASSVAADVTLCRESSHGDHDSIALQHDCGRLILDGVDPFTGSLSADRQEEYVKLGCPIVGDDAKSRLHRRFMALMVALQPTLRTDDTIVSNFVSQRKLLELSRSLFSNAEIDTVTRHSLLYYLVSGVVPQHSSYMTRLQDDYYLDCPPVRICHVTDYCARVALALAAPDVSDGVYDKMKGEYHNWFRTTKTNAYYSQAFGTALASQTPADKGKNKGKEQDVEDGLEKEREDMLASPTLRTHIDTAAATTCRLQQRGSVIGSDLATRKEQMSTVNCRTWTKKFEVVTELMCKEHPAFWKEAGCATQPVSCSKLCSAAPKKAAAIEFPDTARTLTADQAFCYAMSMLLLCRDGGSGFKQQDYRDSYPLVAGTCLSKTFVDLYSKEQQQNPLSDRLGKWARSNYGKAVAELLTTCRAPPPGETVNEQKKLVSAVQDALQKVIAAPLTTHNGGADDDLREVRKTMKKLQADKKEKEEVVGEEEKQEKQKERETETEPIARPARPTAKQPLDAKGRPTGGKNLAAMQGVAAMRIPRHQAPSPHSK